jgi:hypothetical protein
VLLKKYLKCGNGFVTEKWEEAKKIFDMDSGNNDFLAMTTIVDWGYGKEGRCRDRTGSSTKKQFSF